MSYNTSPTNFLTPNMVRCEVLLQGQGYSDASNPVTVKNSLIRLSAGGLIQPVSVDTVVATCSDAFLGIALDTSVAGTSKLMTIALMGIAEYLLNTPAATTIGSKLEPTLDGGSNVVVNKVAVGSTDTIGVVVKSSTAVMTGTTVDRVLGFFKAHCLTGTW